MSTFPKFLVLLTLMLTGCTPDKVCKPETKPDIAELPPIDIISDAYAGAELCDKLIETDQLVWALMDIYDTDCSPYEKPGEPLSQDCYMLKVILLHNLQVEMDLLRSIPKGKYCDVG